MTREHIVAHWVRRELERDTGEGAGRWLRVRGDARNSRTEDYTRFDIAGFLLCRECNNGWSAALERRANGVALRLIRPAVLAASLSAAQQGVLGAWLAKMAVLDEFMEDRISEDYARVLLGPLVSGSSAGNARIWVGVLDRHPYFRHGWWRMDIANGIVHAISAGDLLALVLLPSEHARGPATFAPAAGTLNAIWPAPVDLFWPPLRKVPIESLNKAFGVSPRID